MRARLLAAALLAIPGLVHADAFSDGIAAYRAGDPMRAADIFRTLARQQNADAEYNIAVLFRYGQGVPQNYAKALYWGWMAELSRVARAAPLVAGLRRMMPQGQVTEVAAQLEAEYRRRAKAGDTQALLPLGMVLADPLVGRDPVEGYAWEAMAAALDVGGAAAQRDLTARHLSAEDLLTAQDRAGSMFRNWCAGPGADVCGQGTGPDPKTVQPDTGAQPGDS